MEEHSLGAGVKSALILVDVINHFDFPDGRDLLQNSLAIAGPIRRLKERARAARLPVIYVNDNFGRWRSDFRQVLDRCMECGGDVKSFVSQLSPDDRDYVLLKPKHSGFYCTPLDLLIKDLGIQRLILAGIATNSCILCTAHDANMRDLKLAVPADCCASRSSEEHEHAIDLLCRMVGADVTSSTDAGFQLNPED